MMWISSSVMKTMLAQHLCHWEANGRLVQRIDTILPCLEVKRAASEESPLVDATFLDGAVVVQMLNPGIAKTLLDYVEQVFCHRYQQSSRTLLLLILFGMYIKQRGKCVRRRVVTSELIPKILKDFVPVNDNMVELFSFMSRQVALLQRTVYETNGPNVLCSLTQIERCCQEGLHETVGAYSWY